MSLPTRLPHRRSELCALRLSSRSPQQVSKELPFQFLTLCIFVLTSEEVSVTVKRVSALVEIILTVSHSRRESRRRSSLSLYLFGFPWPLNDRMVSNEARDRLFGAEPPALDLTDASFATQGRFNQAAQDFLLFRWDGLNATPCNELYLLHSIAASIYIGDKRGVFQCRQGTVNDYPVDDPGSSDDSKLRPPKYVISVLMTPEVFLDEERRLVAGSFTTMEGSAVVGSSMEGAKVEYHGRFVINLDNPGEILAAQKVQGEKEEATVIILSYPVRAYGLGGAKMWAVRGDDGGIRQGNWPSQGMSIAHFRPCCPFCTASGILCQCPDSMLNRYFPLSQRRFAGWDEMRHFLSFQNVSHTIVTSLTRKA